MLKNANLELRVCSGATSEDDLAADSSSFPGIASVACAFHPCCFSCFRGAAQGSSLYRETYVFHVGLYDYQSCLYSERDEKESYLPAMQIKPNRTS